MKKLFTSTKFVFGFPICIFLANMVLVLILIQRPDLEHWSFSLILHLLGGASMAVLFFYFWEKNPELYLFKNKLLINLILALGFVALIGVLWELSEFSFDCYFPRLIFCPMQPSLQDTMADLFFDLVGGCAAALLYFKASLYKESPLSK